MASWVKALITKPDNLSSVSGTHVVEMSGSHKLFSDFLIYTMAHFHKYIYLHVHTQICFIYICVYIYKIVKRALKYNMKNISSSDEWNNFQVIYEVSWEFQHENQTFFSQVFVLFTPVIKFHLLRTLNFCSSASGLILHILQSSIYRRNRNIFNKNIY